MVSYTVLIDRHQPKYIYIEIVDCMEEEGHGKLHGPDRQTSA